MECTKKINSFYVRNKVNYSSLTFSSLNTTSKVKVEFELFVHQEFHHHNSVELILTNNYSNDNYLFQSIEYCFGENLLTLKLDSWIEHVY